MQQPASYNVDENGIIYFGNDYLVASKDTAQDLKKLQKSKSKKTKRKKRKKKSKLSNINTNKDPHTTLYYFNCIVDIVGAEFFAFCTGYSLNYLFCTDLRNWGKIISSNPSDTYRWRLFEKDAIDRIQKLVHHYRKLYSYFDRKPDPQARYRQTGFSRGRGRGRGRGRPRYDQYNKKPVRPFREGFNTPLLLFAVYDLNDITNKDTLYAINKISLNNLLQNHLFERKTFLNYVSDKNCLHLKIILYLYLNAIDAVRLFKHNNFEWASCKLLPTPTPTFQQIQNEQLIAKRIEMLENGESVQNLPPIKPFEMSVKDKIMQHQEVQLKMWMHNFCRIQNLDNNLKKLVIHEPDKYYANELMRINKFKEKNQSYFDNSAILKKYKYVNPTNIGYKYLKKRNVYNQRIAEYMQNEYDMNKDGIFEDNLEVKVQTHKRLSKLTLKRIKFAIDGGILSMNYGKKKLREMQIALKLAYEYHMRDTTELQISYENFLEHLNELRHGTSKIEMELIVHKAVDRLGYPGNGSSDIVKYWISLPKLIPKCKFKLVIIPKWFNIFKYVPEWRRFNKQLREFFCPNLLRIRLLYLFISTKENSDDNTKGTLFGWTYNNRILVFQALLSDPSRN